MRSWMTTATVPLELRHRRQYPAPCFGSLVASSRRGGRFPAHLETRWIYISLSFFILAFASCIVPVPFMLLHL